MFEEVKKLIAEYDENQGVPGSKEILEKFIRTVEATRRQWGSGNAADVVGGFLTAFFCIGGPLPPQLEVIHEKLKIIYSRLEGK